MKKIYASAAVIFIAMMTMGCDVPVPITEMVAAKSAIARAYTVKADKYAPTELSNAEKKLYETHDFVKTEAFDKAKSSAELSKKNADDAYNKALPLLAKDTIATAKNSIAQAEEAYAEKLAQDEFQSAKDALNAAETQFNGGKYWDAYLTALDADKKAKNARNVAVGKKELLKDSIDEVKLTLKKVQEFENTGAASGKISAANENLAIAEESYNNLQLKKGFSAIQVAKVNADEALLLASEGTAKEKIAGAEVLLEEASKSEGSKIALDELAAARESLNNAKVMLANSRYREVLDYTKEANRLSSIVIATKKSADSDQDKNKGKIVKGSGEEKDGDKDGDKDKSSLAGKDKTEDADNYYYKVKYRSKTAAAADCLWNIAGTYYKNPRLWTEIYKANKNQIKDPNLILPNWIIKVPKRDKK